MNARALLLTVFGLGLLRPAPGTWGSLPPVALALALVWIVWPERWIVDVSLVLLGLVFAIVCVRFGTEAEKHFGCKDPREVVADEVAGCALPLLLLPWRAPVDGAAWAWNVGLAATGFIWFRIFDISKLPPVRRSERLGGGWGILVDDLIAGVYALIATQIVVRWLFP